MAMTTLSIPDPMVAVSLPMLVLLGKATVLLLAALGVTVALRRASAGFRHLIWLGALGAVLVLPALGAWSPLQLAVFPASFATSTSVSQWLAGGAAVPTISEAGRTPGVGRAGEIVRRPDRVAAPGGV